MNEQTRIKQLIKQCEQDTQYLVQDLSSDSFLYRLVELTIEDCVNKIEGLKDITNDALKANNFQWNTYKETLNLVTKVIKRTTATDEELQKYRSKIIDDEGYCRVCGETWNSDCGCALELKE